MGRQDNPYLMMDFADKLSLLTQVFKISNSKLARAINVDASLISRWKTGDRILKADSRHLAELATFFVQAQAYPYQKQYLNKLLVTLQPESASLSEDDKIHLLANWLIQPDHQLPAHLSPDNEPALIGRPEKLINSISSWLEKGHGPSQTKLPDMHYPTKHSFTFQQTSHLKDEFYTGLDGKRQAVINFLMEVLDQPRQAELLLISEESMLWLISDQDFLLIWANLLQQVIRQGHKITIIHIVNRRTDEISNVFEYWLPLHLSGQIDSFYMPRYVDPVINQTIFILRGRLVCLSQSTPDPKTQGLTILSREAAVVSHYTTVYESVLRGCQPFFSIYTPQNIQTLAESAASYQTKVTQYNVRQQPDTSFLPAAAKDELSRFCYPGQPLRTVQTANKPAAYDLLPLEFLEQIQHESILLKSDCQLFLRKPYQLSNQASAAWLDKLIWRLREDPAYSLYLYRTPAGHQSLTFNLSYYSNQAAHFAAKTSKEPFIIALHEANSLHSLGLFLENFISRIPSSQRNRKDVVARLLLAADHLKERFD